MYSYIMESSEHDQLENEVEKAIRNLRLTMLRQKAREIEKTDGREAVAERLSDFDYYIDQAIRNQEIVSLSEQVLEEIDSTPKEKFNAVAEESTFEDVTSEEDAGSASEEDVEATSVSKN